MQEAKPKPHPVSQVNLVSRLFALQNPYLILESQVGFPNRNLQWERDFRPFNIRRRRTSMPPLELNLLIQPCVLLRLMFLGWYSVPLFLVRTCWICHGRGWNTPEPSACKEIGPHLVIWGLATDLGPIQLLNNLRWELPVRARFPTGTLLIKHISISLF